MLTGYLIGVLWAFYFLSNALSKHGIKNLLILFLRVIDRLPKGKEQPMEIQVLEARSSKGYRKKVCAYCRVSTDHEDQANSFERKTRSHTMKIWSNRIQSMNTQVSIMISPFPVIKKSVPVFRRCLRMPETERLIWYTQNPYHGLQEIPPLF